MSYFSIVFLYSDISVYICQAKQCLISAMFSYIQYRSVYIFQAKQCLTQALTFKRHEITYLMIGKILLMEGNITGAIDIYRQAVE
jgi:hypothetical protein